MAYLLDTNVFIEGAKRWYGFDICPGFWEWLLAENAAGLVRSITAVRDEMLVRVDDLSDWVSAMPEGFFLAPDPAVLPAMHKLAAWVHQQSYRPAAIREFLESADYHLIAYAMTHGHTVVTLEVPSDSRKQVKIPEPCVAHGVSYVTPFMMLRRSKASFGLKTFRGELFAGLDKMAAAGGVRPRT